MCFASSRPDPLPAKRDNAMKTKIVSYTPETLPPLTKADRARLKALAARPDNKIDTSDIPEMTDEQWKKAKRGHFYRPRILQITSRVAADELAWLMVAARRLTIAHQRHPAA